MSELRILIQRNVLPHLIGSNRRIARGRTYEGMPGICHGREVRSMDWREVACKQGPMFALLGKRL